ncbi:MAG: tryptophan--tRNA ligase [Bacilli bacterium]|nr:tryptophan--tRNA ligase [Bacilli bacterium]
MEKVLTGIQPSGALTLGNYIGAIKQMLKYQDMYESYIFIADMHAITIPQDPIKLRENIRSLLAIYLASGVDPKKNTIFLQSENIYHANVSWILECLTPYGELGRMTQFKDKKEKNANFSAGLLTYPVLMASDILLYDVDFVPVGKDQKQHVELARNIAERVNKKYGEIFKVPLPLIPHDGAKICDLVDPTRKMSKSSDNPKGVIYLLDDEKTIRKKIMSATTDSEMRVVYDMENKPGISNLINIYTSLSNLTIKDVEEKYKDSNYGTFKNDVADLVVSVLTPIQEKYYKLLESAELDKILDAGIEKTTSIAKEKYELLKEKVGLYR